jgi:hypothetical protein
MPIAFGVALNADALRTAAVFCLLFGGGCQFIAGLISLRNGNLLGGTLFTTFAFNWVINFWSLWGMSQGKMPSAPILLAVDVCFLCIFLVLTLAAGYASKLLFFFLLDLDLLFVCRITKELTHSAALALPIAGLSAVLMVLALWIALGHLLNASAGRVLIPLGGPMFKGGAAGH